MAESATTTPQAPAAAEPANTAAPAATTTSTDDLKAKASGEFKSEESKNAVLADLAKERDARQALEQQIADIKKDSDERNKRLAEALGFTEAPKDEDDLAGTVKSIQEQLTASQREATRLQIAAAPGVDAEGKPLPAIPPEFHHLLTETDPEKLKAQAVTVSALVKANTAGNQTPEFQPHPGQGLNGQSLSDQAKADAEYEQFYPTPNRK